MDRDWWDQWGCAVCILSLCVGLYVLQERVDDLAFKVDLMRSHMRPILDDYETPESAFVGVDESVKISTEPGSVVDGN